MDAVLIAHVFHEAPETTPDVEDGESGLQSELAADERHLGTLGLLQGLDVLPVGAAILHVRIEHGLVEVVADIVMVLGRLRAL